MTTRDQTLVTPYAQGLVLGTPEQHHRMNENFLQQLQISLMTQLIL